MLQGQWEAELLRVLRQTKATMACQAQEGQPTLYPFLCLLSEGEFVSMLLQVGQGWTPGRGTGGRVQAAAASTLVAPRFCGFCQHRVSPSSTWLMTWAFGS